MTNYEDINEKRARVLCQYWRGGAFRAEMRVAYAASCKPAVRRCRDPIKCACTKYNVVHKFVGGGARTSHLMQLER